MQQYPIGAYFDDKQDLLVEAVSRLVRIESTLGQPQPGKPFGEGPAAAVDEFLSIAGELGLAGENLEGYVGVVDLNQEETALHILGHLDVVEAGDGWSVTEPFIPKVLDGMIYGRGTDDDKGPMIAALLAMKAVKDLQVPLTKNVRLIAGTDEESGFRDIRWYYERHPFAPYTFSPDGDFPIVNIEKGHYQPTFRASWPQQTALPRVCSFTGGPRLNMVPPKASALVAGLTMEAIQAEIDTLPWQGITFTLTRKDNRVSILCTGLGAHASTPEEGRNAQTALLSLLARLPLADGSSTRAIRTLASWFPHGDFIGRAFGIAQEDALSGPLTLSFTRLNLDDTGMEGRFDCRTPLCGTEESVRLFTEEAMVQAGFSIQGELDPPHHVPADSPFLRVLAKCYEQYSGRKSQCLAIGGGTYVHGIPGGVAFGATMPGFVSNLHGPDERASIRDLLTAAKIFTQVIIDLCS
ncbi:MAG: Sapep family Mn(2+)-dependent dipeptidase [Evtepia sp.]|uniref:Sapep family Mn(2+)-dependent dipeptidase n=1 Tax=Evtepia sp. TaxID=2773933 RepID=UPI002A763C14|nr:Sapep family Mn(2+)-dependent dipeptidase [Evtepia sp.]MDY3015000.1 Sapep family Mn(2+)-dependent dipeptidase [Evtepia sp.]